MKVSYISVIPFKYQFTNRQKKRSEKSWPDEGPLYQSDGLGQAQLFKPKG